MVRMLPWIKSGGRTSGKMMTMFAEDSLEAKYMAEDASSKKFLVSNFTNYKMTNSRPILKQYNELLDFKHTLKHKKEELTLVELGSHLRIEESLGMQDSDKPKGNNVVGPSVVNMDDDVAWWVNSGAIVHVCKDRCWFKTYESLNDGSILHMGNESTALVHGRGYVNLRFSSGKIVSLFNVLHVPNIRKNLVSSNVLNNCGYKQVTESNKFILSKHGAFISFGYLSNHMFKLNIVNDNIGSAFMSTSKLNDSILWHARLGHVHFKRMQDMSKDGLIPAFDMDTEKCKTCMLTKITKKPFQNVKRETEVLELIHSDLCDLHATPSLGNKKYFVTFIDDASRFCYVYLLHTKDEALDKFKVFKTEVELQQGSLIKRFRTDRGGEYMDTLYFQSVGLSQGFWGEAMLTACYLLNRVPNKRNKITPYELWTKRKPNLNYLRVWGCRAVVRLPDPKLKTLGERGIECIFVGYVEHSKAFRPSLRIPKEIGGSVVPVKVTKEVVQQHEPELRKSKRNRTPKNFRREFQLYLIKGIRDEVANSWLQMDLQKKTEGISTIRLLIAMASIHNRTIHQMDVKTAFLNGELEEEIYMNQPQ
ncbi:zinc finger, CCHC-type containing protein [Tanacetum coccineum]